jgi:hypothetical protein
MVIGLLALPLYPKMSCLSMSIQELRFWKFPNVCSAMLASPTSSKYLFKVTFFFLKYFLVFKILLILS